MSRAWSVLRRLRFMERRAEGPRSAECVVETGAKNKRSRTDTRAKAGAAQTYKVVCPAIQFGTANATTESPIFVPSFPCPPAQITTYCLPLNM